MAVFPSALCKFVSFDGTSNDICVDAPPKSKAPQVALPFKYVGDRNVVC